MTHGGGLVVLRLLISVYFIFRVKTSDGYECHQEITSSNPSRSSAAPITASVQGGGLCSCRLRVRSAIDQVSGGESESQ